MGKKLGKRELAKRKKIRDIKKIYAKATALRDELQKQGFDFSTRTTNRLDFSRLQKALEKPTKRYLDSLKAIGSKYKMMNKAKGFEDPETGEVLQVKAAIKKVRRETREKQKERSLSIKYAGMIMELISDFPDEVEGRVGVMWKTVDFMSRKKALLDKVETDFINGVKFGPAEYTRLDDAFGAYRISAPSRKIEMAQSLYDIANAVIEGGSTTDGLGGGVETIGTPYEGTDEYD